MVRLVERISVVVTPSLIDRDVLKNTQLMTVSMIITADIATSNSMIVKPGARCLCGRAIGYDLTPPLIGPTMRTVGLLRPGPGGRPYHN